MLIWNVPETPCYGFDVTPFGNFSHSAELVPLGLDYSRPRSQRRRVVSTGASLLGGQATAAELLLGQKAMGQTATWHSAQRQDTWSSTPQSVVPQRRVAGSLLQKAESRLQNAATRDAVQVKHESAPARHWLCAVWTALASQTPKSDPDGASSASIIIIQPPLHPTIIGPFARLQTLSAHSCNN